jgi:FemAB-related protein (PEP-CTERM system-associated)
MHIKEINSAAEWDEFVKKSTSGTCFHLFGWKDPLEAVLGYECHYVGAYENELLVGVFPFAVVRSRLFGTSVCSLPFCSYGGPLAQDSIARAALVDYAVSIAKKSSADRVEMRCLHEQVDSEHQLDLYYTFRKNLPKLVDDWSFLPSKRRNMVRKGVKEGLKADVSHDLDSFFHLYAENARAHGTPALPKQFFEHLLRSLGEHVDILFVRTSDGTAISCIMSFYYEGEVHAGFAGELPLARSSAANDFKYWSLVQHAITRSCVLFDFGRSKKGTGSFTFKTLWGFEPQLISHRFELLEGASVPDLNPTNRKFALALMVWKRLPRFVVDFIGPKVLHGLG